MSSKSFSLNAIIPFIHLMYIFLLDEFQCKFTETCIPKTKMCDSNPDCDDLSDEEDCRKVECTSNEFKCNNGKCIPNTFVCDNDVSSNCINTL